MWHSDVCRADSTFLIFLVGSKSPSPARADTPAEQPQGKPRDPWGRPGRPLTLVEFIQTAGVAEGAEGSCLPAAPTLHPHRGTARPSLPPTWPAALGRRRTHGHEERAAQGNVLIPVPHLPSSIPGTCRQQGTTAPSSKQPHTSMHHGAALTPSLPENPLVLPKSRAWRTAPAAQPGQVRIRDTALGYPAPNPEGCCFLGREGEIWKLVPLNAAGGYF